MEAELDGGERGGEVMPGGLGYSYGQVSGE
jgi:hypothetical protein